jgi:hypothetical protein
MKCVAQLSLAALLLLGCAHRSLLQEQADKFVGQPVSAVTAKIGIPTEEHEVGGARLYVWSSAADRGESSQGVCTLRATVRGDLIGSFDWEGTEGQCADYALMLKGSDCRSGTSDVRRWLPSCGSRDKSQ